MDWTAIKAEYVTTGISMRKLAKKHDVPESTLMKRACREGWATEREQNSSKAVARAADAYVEEAAEKLAVVRRATERLADIALERLTDAEDELKSGDVLAYARALRETNGILRELYGVPTMAQRHAWAQAEARLELERKRLDAQDADTEVEIVFPPEAEEWTG